jgi:hypothetical protein
MAASVTASSAHSKVLSFKKCATFWAPQKMRKKCNIESFSLGKVSDIRS